MSERDSAAIGRQYFKTWNKRDFDTLSSLFTQDAEVVDVPAGMTQRGPAGARQEAERWADAFPDGKVEVMHTIAGSTGVLVEGILRGTNTAPAPGSPPCPKRPPDRVLARVYDDEVVVAVNMPYCYDCARPEPRPSPYETVEATETLVRSLHLRTPRR